MGISYTCKTYPLCCLILRKMIKICVNRTYRYMYTLLTQYQLRYSNAAIATNSDMHNINKFLISNDTSKAIVLIDRVCLRRHSGVRKCGHQQTVHASGALYADSYGRSCSALGEYLAGLVFMLLSKAYLYRQLLQSAVPFRTGQIRLEYCTRLCETVTQFRVA